MVHLRIVVPADRTDRALELLLGADTVCNVVRLDGVARRPDGDVLLCDVAHEDASIVIADLKGIDVHRDGSIALENIDSALSQFAVDAAQRAEGAVSDAVVWEQVEEKSSESVELSGVFVVFMMLAALLAAIGIYLDSPLLVIGGMVVGPEFGPIAGVCVAVVQRRRSLAVRSAIALAVGFPLAILSVFAAVLALKGVGVMTPSLEAEENSLAVSIASPDVFAFLVAVCAGIAGVLSLSTAKSGALIGVLISVTTIPAAADMGLSAAYADWSAFRGSTGQLALNLGAVLLAGTLTLSVQRLSYRRRLARHRRENTTTMSAPGAAVPR